MLVDHFTISQELRLLSEADSNFAEQIFHRQASELDRRFGWYHISFMPFVGCR